MFNRQIRTGSQVRCNGIHLIIILPDFSEKMALHIFAGGVG